MGRASWWRWTFVEHAWSLSPRWDLLFAIAYSAEFGLGRAVLDAVLDAAITPAGTTARILTSFTPPDPVRHQFSLQLGAGLRF